MYNEEYDNEQNEKASDNFLVNFYYNNKILIWILIGVIAFILIMSLLTKSGSSGSSSKSYNVTIESSTENVVIAIGRVTSLRAKVENNANAKVQWSSDNENVATVSDNGVVTAVNYGKAKIYATYIHNNEQKYTSEPKEVTVADGDANLKLTDVSFVNGDLLMPLNSTYTIRVSLTPANGFITNKVFSSTNERVATVDSNGLVTAVGEGEAIINLNVNDSTFRKELKVFVSKDYTRSEIIVNPETISFDGELRKMKIGSKERLTYTVFPTDTTTSKLVWTSSKEDVATVDKNGYVTALKSGNTTITLTSISGVKDSIDIEVEESVVAVTDINVGINSLYLNVGQSETITPIVLPADASNKSLSFITGNSSVIAINPNQTGTAVTVYGVSAGTTTLTIIASNNVERRLNVTVSGSSSNGGSSSSSGGSSSSSSNLGFTLTSQDANWATTHEGFIVNAYSATVNNSATAPVLILANITSSSIAKLRIAACLYTASSCDPDSSSAHEIKGSGSFTLNNAGTYILKVAKYNSKGSKIGTVDRYIAIGNTANNNNNNNTGSGTFSISTLKVEFSDDCTRITSVKFNGSLLSSSNYTAVKQSSGSTAVTWSITGKGNYNGGAAITCYVKTGGNTQKTYPKIEIENSSLTIGESGTSSVLKLKSDTPGTFTISASNTACAHIGALASTTAATRQITSSNTNTWFTVGVYRASSSGCSTLINVRFTPSDTTKYSSSTKTASVIISTKKDTTGGNTGGNTATTKCYYTDTIDDGSISRCNGRFNSKEEMEKTWSFQFSGKKYGCIANYQGKYNRYQCYNT